MTFPQGHVFNYVEWKVKGACYARKRHWSIVTCAERDQEIIKLGCQRPKPELSLRYSTYF